MLNLQPSVLSHLLSYFLMVFAFFHDHDCDHDCMVVHYGDDDGGDGVSEHVN